MITPTIPGRVALATSPTGPTVINVCDYGANGNRDTADPTANTTAIQAAFDAAVSAPNAFSATVYFPPGQYLVNGPITLSSGTLEGGLTILGSGRRSSFLLWTTDTPILQFDCRKTSMSSVTISQLGFFYQGAANPTTANAIGIFGTQSFGFERALFQALGFYGPMTAAIASWNTDSGSGYVNSFAIRWSVFDDIDFDTGGQSGPPNRCVWHKNSSGTGNIYSNFTGGGTASIIEIGDGVCNCGDMLIQGIQGGHGADMIKLTGGSSYMERVSILNCQADGNVKNGLTLLNMGQFEVRNFLWGGATTWNLQNCYDYVIDGAPGSGGQCMQSAIHRGYKWNTGGVAVYSEEHETYNGTYGGGELFTISFPGSAGYQGNAITSNDGNFAVMIEITANGTVTLPNNGGTAPLVCRFTGVVVVSGTTASFSNPVYDGVPGLTFTVDTSTTSPAISVAAANEYSINGPLGARIRSVGSAHWVARG